MKTYIVIQNVLEDSIVVGVFDSLESAIVCAKDILACVEPFSFEDYITIEAWDLNTQRADRATLKHGDFTPEVWEGESGD